MKNMLHKNAIRYVKQEYTLIYIYYVIRFGIIQFSLVRIPKLWYSVFWYFTRFGPPLVIVVMYDNATRGYSFQNGVLGWGSIQKIP